MILQDLCCMKLGWDDEIPEECQQRWRAWLENLPKLEHLAIDRCFKLNVNDDVESIQLHHFSDVSQLGYGAASYLRIKYSTGNIKCSFVMGKSRLAPIKPVMIPRMELSAAVVSTKLDRIVRNELTLPVDQTFFWTDSTCVLRYIANITTRYQTFVANRIATIHDTSAPSQWHYVDTKSNPADDGSRGVSADSQGWWLSGPDFLRKEPGEWPQQPQEMYSTIPQDDPEVKNSSVYSTSLLSPRKDYLNEMIERFSSWNRLKRVLAWILHYMKNLISSCKSKEKLYQSSTSIKPLTVNELLSAETEIVKHVQRSCFKDELRQLNQRNGNNSVSKSSSLSALNPILIDGLVRVRGRLQRAHINSDVRHPIILPKSHNIVHLIIRHYHQVAGHSGQEHTLSLIRQWFWPIKARTIVRKVLNSCTSCKKCQAPAAEQKMASLPSDCTTSEKPPFTYTGLDCFGPFEVRRGRSTVKRYGVIFTCLTIHAIHIEIANSLDTKSFINALRRFITRRGTPEEMHSDNKGNFVKGERELRQAILEWNQSQIHDFLCNIKWTFNPPAGSHHGGVWERCIRTVCKVMKALVKEQLLGEENLHTLMCKVEAIVNGRPLTKLSDDPRDLKPLTPNHLLLLRNGSKLPPGVFSKKDSSSLRRWRQVQYLANVFWKRWIREYLPSLQERQKWRKIHRNLEVGDLVLILDEKTPCCSWPLGRVLQVHKNQRDGLVHSVKVKTCSTVLVRPVDKIIFLESVATPVNDK